MLSLANKRDRLIALASAWLCLGLCCLSWAQPPKGPPKSGSKESREFWSLLSEASKDSINNRFYFMGMIEHPAIQTEIELTTDELREIDALNHLHMDEVRKLRDDYVKSPDKQVCKRALSNLLREQDAAFMQKLKAAANFERLLQISVQVYGHRAVTQDDVAQQIGLSDEKLSEIRHLSEKIRQDEFEKMGDTIREIVRSGPQSGKRVRDVFQQIDNKINEAIKLKLTTQQLEALTQHKGAAFDIPDDLFERRRNGRSERYRDDRGQDPSKRDLDSKEPSSKERGNKEHGNKPKDGCANRFRIVASLHS